MIKAKSRFEVYVRILILIGVFLLVSVSAFSGASAFGQPLSLSSIPSAFKSLFKSEFFSVIPIGIFMGVALPFLNPIRASLLTLLAAILIFIVSFVGAVDHNDLLLEFGLLSIGIVFSVHVLSTFFTEYHDKKRLSQIFSQYIPPELVKEYVSNPGLIDLDGVSCELTTLFCDIRGFTGMSEKLPPKEVVQIINHFSTLVTRVILKNRGTIDKYVGDSVMAFWGAPMPNPNHASAALTAGMEIQQEMILLRELFKVQGWPEIYVGVGINTGVCSVGNMGSSLRITYTAMGDSVNVAERIEKLTRRYKVPVVIGEATLQKLPGLVYREIDFAKVRGRKKYMNIYEPVGMSEMVSKEVVQEIEAYHHALSIYRDQKFAEAVPLFETLCKQHPGIYLYELYRESAKVYLSNPPEKMWRGAACWEVYKAQ